MKKLTKQDLINGRDFWTWALDNPRAYKEDWPECKRIAEYRLHCPFCELYFSAGFCPDCPMTKKRIRCEKTKSDPYTIWSESKGSDNNIKKAIQKIIDVYQEEIDKLSGGTL